jgi:ABC-2 type transport system permease protein
MIRWQWRVAALANGLKDATAYRIEFFMEVIGSAAVPALIQWILWYAMYITGGQKEIAGLSYQQMLAYTWMSILFSQVRGGNHDFALMELIRSGNLSNYLLRPVSPVEFFYIRGVAEKLFVTVICLLIGLGISFFTDLSPMNMLGAMVLALMGNIIHYQFGAVLATLAFLWEEAYSILMVKNMIVQILSGELIPLNLFPENLQWVWKITPFYLYVYGPTQYALGRWTHTEFVHALWVASAWIIFFTIAIKVSWKVGIKRYLSLGG